MAWLLKLAGQTSGTDKVQQTSMTISRRAGGLIAPATHCQFRILQNGNNGHL